MVIIVVLIGENTTSHLAGHGSCRSLVDARVDNDIVVAAFGVPEVILAATPRHEIACVVEKLRSVIMIDGPDARVTVDQEISSQDVVFLNDRSSRAVLLVHAVAIVHSTICEIRLAQQNTQVATDQSGQCAYKTEAWRFTPVGPSCYTVRDRQSLLPAPYDLLLAIMLL